jgi:hypothetical protein
VIFVIGFVSWDIVGDIKQELKAEFIAEIEGDIDSKRERIQELLIRSDLLADRVTGTIDAVEKQLTAFQPRANELDAMYRKVDSLNVDAQNFVDIYNQEVLPLVTNVNALSQQLGVLAEQVNQINTIFSTANPAAGGVPEAVSAARSEVIQSVINQSDDVQARLTTERTRNTVFVQFANGSREDAQNLAASLKHEGFYVPGEELTRNALGQREVRYFHTQDQAAAEELAAVATRALREQGDSDSAITTKDFTQFPNKKPRPGVLELWVDLPRTTVQQQAF